VEPQPDCLLVMYQGMTKCVKPLRHLATSSAK
jgi:hypothetical protein